MKIVQLLTSSTGGAAQAAWRLNDMLCKAGIDSQIVVLNDNENGVSGCAKIYRNKTREKIEKTKIKLNHVLNNCFFKAIDYDFRIELYGSSLRNIPEIESADIIHIHWASEFIHFKELKSLSNKKKIVWTLHDMWLFTGGCFYDQNCNGYTKGCMNCPAFSWSKARQYQISKRYEKKIEVINNSITAVVGCSKWITECGLSSRLSERVMFKNIPNPIDVSVFVDKHRKMARKKFNFDSEHIYVLVGAMSPTDERKGYRYFKEVTEILDQDKYVAVLYGNTNGKKINLGIPTVEMGPIHDRDKLIDLYNAVDVFVAPSVQENLANTVMESLACGTPVVAFNIGGMPDMITSFSNGYLSKPFGIFDMKFGIEECARHYDYRVAARNSVVSRFSYDKLIGSYIELYQDVIK